MTIINHNRRRAAGRLIFPTWLAAAILLAGSGCGREADPSSDAPRFQPDRTAMVEYVIDGDTVIVEGDESIRFLGIDTPEIRKWTPDGWRGRDEPWGRDATHYLHQLIGDKEVGLIYDGERTDFYGRTLAYLTIDDILVNARLLREGYATYMDMGKTLKYGDYLRRAEAEARAAARGLWSERRGSFRPPDYYVAGRDGNLFHRKTCGTVDNIHEDNRFRVRREAARKLGLEPCPRCLPE